MTLKDDFFTSPYSMKDYDGGLDIDHQVSNSNDNVDEDERIIDNDTIVRNLKSSRLELREKLFVDKSIRK